MLLKILRITALLFCLVFNQAWAAELPQAGDFPVGEHMEFVIKYWGVPIGTAESTVLGLETIRGRKAYHIQALVKSSPVIDVIHKVRGEHHSYIDAEKMCSLRYETRKIGAPEPYFIMEIDPASDSVRYVYPVSGKEKKFAADPGAQDQLSLAYVFRMISIAENKSVSLPLHADQKKWQVPVDFKKIVSKKNSALGAAQAIEAEPYLGFVNALSKKGRVRGWMTADQRRIPVSLEVKVPFLGAVKVELSKYSFPENPKK